MRYLRAGIVLYAVLLLTLSHGAKMRVAPGPGADFARYKTYQWLPVRVLTSTGVVEDDPVFTPLVKDAINRQLQQRGMTEVTEGGDLQVSTGILNTYVPQLEAVIFAGPSMMYSEPIANMGRYNREGTLVVNLIDTATKKSAWAGIINENIDNKPGAGQKKIAPAAAKLFKKYPGTK